MVARQLAQAPDNLEEATELVRSSASAVITGAGRGIGETIAHRLAAEDLHVVVVDVDDAAAQSVAAAIRSAGGRAAGLAADVGSQTDLVRVFNEVDEGFPSLKILVNNAGIASEHPYPSAPFAEWRRVIDVNLIGTMLAAQLARERMLRSGGGLIVNICSTAGIGYGPHPNPEYAATKAAIARLTATLGSLAGEHVRVNAICPGWVATAKVRAYLESLSPEDRRTDVPMELIEPSDIADLVVMLWRDPSVAGRVVVWRDGEPWRFEA